MPASVPYIFAKNLSTALPSASKTISTAATSLASSIDFSAWLKKAALRAAGEEGLAENVRNFQGETFGIDAVNAAQVSKAQEEIRYRLTTKKVHCLDTSGQVFAILLNAIYLIPLAYLFCEFFYTAYVGNAKTKRVESEKDEPIPTTPENIKKSAQEAVSRVTTKVKQAIEDTQGGVTEPPPDVKAQIDDLHTKSKQIAKNAEEAIRDKSIKAQEELQRDVAKMQERLKVLREKGNDVGEKAVTKIKEIAADLSENAKKGAAKAKQGAQDLSKKAKEGAGPILDAAANTADNVKQGAQHGYEKATAGSSQNGQAVKEEAKAAANEADKKAEEAGKKGEDAKDTAKKSAEETSDKVKGKSKETGDKAKEKSKETAEEVSKDIKDEASKSSEDTKKLAEDASAVSQDEEKTSAVEDKDTDQTNDAVQKDKENDDEKKEDSENLLVPSASTGDERSVRSDDTGSASRASTPGGTPDRSRKSKKDKKK